RLRVRSPDPRRRAPRGRAQSQLPRRLRDLLAQPRHGGRRIDARAARHPLLRQGRADAGGPGRPRLAGLPVRRHRRLRRCLMSAPRAGPSPDRLPSRSGQSGAARRPPGKHWFLALADATCAPSAAATLGVDRVLLHVASEDSVFARFNRSAVRQLTRVDQREATVSLVRGRRRIAATVDLGGDIDADIASLRALRDGLARDLALVPEDPHLRLPEVVVDTDRDDGDPGDAVYAATRQAPAATGASEGMDADGTTTTLRAVVDQVVTEARGLDFVGIHVDGPVVAAFADSRGQRNWHRVRQHQLDWSLFCQGDPATRGRAVKSRLAGR